MTRTLCYVSFCGTGIALLACICGMLTHLQYVGATLVLLSALLTITVFIGFVLYYTVRSEIDHLDADHPTGANRHPAPCGATSRPAAKPGRLNRRKS